MKKAIIVIVLSVCAMLALAPSALADGVADEYIADFEKLLPSDMSDIVTDTEALTRSVSIEALISEITALISGEGSRIVTFLLALISMGIIGSLAAALGLKLSSATERAVGVIASLLVFSYVGGLFRSMADTMSDICAFFSGAIPIYTAISVSSGAVSTAGAQALGMNFTASLLGGVGISVMTAVVGTGLAMALVSFFGDERTDALSRSVQSFFKWLCGIATALIMATLSLQTVVCSASDSAVLRAARYAASGMIPIVGGAVSGALSTLAAGLAYAKGIVGVGSVAVIVTLALAPLVLLLLYRLALSLAISFVGFVGSPCIRRIYAAYKTALDSLCAVYALCACLCIFEIILFMKSGVVS